MRIIYLQIWGFTCGHNGYGCKSEDPIARVGSDNSAVDAWAPWPHLSCWGGLANLSGGQSCAPPMRKVHSTWSDLKIWAAKPNSNRAQISYPRYYHVVLDLTPPGAKEPSKSLFCPSRFGQFNPDSTKKVTLPSAVVIHCLIDGSENRHSLMGIHLSCKSSTIFYASVCSPLLC